MRAVRPVSPKDAGHECEHGCASLADMRRHHGSPFAFAQAVERAADDLFCSTEEAERAVARYRFEWMKVEGGKP